MQPLAGIVIVVSALCLVFSVPASAEMDGIVGYSGSPGRPLCTSCHFGGGRPNVTLELLEPPDVVAGSVATFRFRVESTRSSQTAGGLNVSASAGTLGILPDEGTRLDSGELTHTAPKDNIGGEATFHFTWQAPAAPGTYTIYAAGNSVNKNGAQDGDNAERTSLAVVVLGAPTPTAEPSATATAPVPTATTVPPTATAISEATATATATILPSGCTGDCDGGGEVTVDEIITGVNIALGSVAPEGCVAFDRNSDGEVTVDEIVEGIQRALNGC
ncbi:MAG TPA: choice-of-anchor V domain-containing protein [Terriglobales bacterium]|nr:choice-of-anchor V domain-containing protein [Terriglobales bacterium]